MSGTILVVDDLPANTRLTEAQLNAADYEVVIASSGAEAIEILESRVEIELVLLDIMMPIMDGFETCRRIRELPRGHELPIVFLTASHESALHRQAIESGADDFLRKPIDRTELLLRVRSLVRIRRLQIQKALLTNLLVHDLKNPLAGIVTNAEFAREDAKDPSRGALDDVISAANGLQRMVMNLLDIGKTEDGALKPVLSNVELATVLEGLVATNHRRLDLRRQRIELSVGREVVRADVDLLTRVLQNLLDNAMRYAPSGSAIRVDLAEGTEGATQIRVRDDGPGVPADARAHIFEKYGQASGTTNRASHGLGLLFCRLVAEAHGGRIWVEDASPRGAIFTLELPRGAS